MWLRVSEADPNFSSPFFGGSECYFGRVTHMKLKCQARDVWEAPNHGVACFLWHLPFSMFGSSSRDLRVMLGELYLDVLSLKIYIKVVG